MRRVISPVNGDRYIKIVPVILEGIDGADLRVGSDGTEARTGSRLSLGGLQNVQSWTQMYVWFIP